MGPNRVLSDTELAEFGYQSRLAYGAPNQFDKLDSYPAARRYNSQVWRNNKFVGGFSNCKLPARWMTFLQSINTPAQWKALWVSQFGWHNFGDRGVVEYVVFVNDTVWVEEIIGDRAYIRSLCLEDNPPDTGKPFWDGYTMVFFSVIHRDGHIFAHDAGWIRTLVLRREKTERVWMETKYLAGV